MTVKGFLGTLSSRLTLTFSLLLSLTTVASLSLADQAQTIIKSHAIAMHGQPKYPSDFERFEYTSPAAVKGGSLKLHSLGTYDSLNAFVAKGNPAAYINLLYDTLTVDSADEPFTQYGLLAQQMEYPVDRSWIIYHLNPAARFHDGEPVTAEDVAFTFNLLIEQGNPFYSYYYADITDVQVLDKHRVKFVLKDGASHETVLIIGQLAILPKHFWKDKDFQQASLERPLGSGPYRIAKVDPGRSITYERVSDYWAVQHPTQRGLYNFDEIQVDYYRDQSVALEAFKAGEYDFRHERTAKNWATAYTGEAITQGRMLKQEIRHHNPTGMQAFIFNLRKPLFQDPVLREAIGLAFNFEWTNDNLFYGAYTRTNSYFSNSDLASSGLPSQAEVNLLEPWRKQLPASVFDSEYSAPVATDSRNRHNLRTAKKMLDEAGYRIVNGQLQSPSGEAVRFEILLYDSAFERIANPFVQALKRLGIEAQVSKVDTSQYINRRRDFDFDMITHVFGQSLSPGNEQRDFWSSEAANTPGSRNLIGIANPVIDDLIDKVIQAKTRQQLLTASHALDRVLLHMHYVIPQWHTRDHKLAYWNKFDQPDTSPDYDIGYNTGLMTWWVKPDLLGQD